MLLPGCEVVYKNEKTGREECWKYEGGLREYLLSEIAAEPLVAPFEAHGYVEDAGDGYAVGEGAAWVVIWTTEGGLERESYVNLIPTPQGGTHEAGLKDGLYQAMLAFMQAHGLQAKNVKILSEDVFSRANFVLSTKALDPQFQGQTKEKLTSRETMKLVSGFVRPQFEFWLNDHIEEGKKLAELIVSQAQARQRQSTKYEKKKSSSVAVLPGKLTDCESDDISMNELFIVEGDSAGGSAKSGRNKEFQAVLPLRGKILNTWEVDADKIFGSDTVHDIAVAIGVDPHPADGAPDLKGLRYGKICILSDADVDGMHIRLLMITFFLQFFPELIKKGHVYILQTPLFRVRNRKNKIGKQKLKELEEEAKAAKSDFIPRYCYSDEERVAAIEALGPDPEITRFKGLGEISPDEFKHFIGPDIRLEQVSLHKSDQVKELLEYYMGKNTMERQNFIINNLVIEEDRAEEDETAETAI